VLACVHSSAVVGLEGVLVEVEVDIGSGNPGLTIVGLPDAAVQEADDGQAGITRRASASAQRSATAGRAFR
jgi:magnesium chelatase family protein